MSAEPANALNRWEELLRGISPLREAERLASEALDPATAGADDCWKVIWTKPLFANVWVEIGEKSVQTLSPFMDGAWREWGNVGGPLMVAHRKGHNSRDNFDVSGHQATVLDALGIARHRLLAIQCGAVMLRNLVKANSDSPMKPFASMTRRQMVATIRASSGRGWGHITALHLLTDFGLAVKPDLHLVRTVKAIGLLPNLREQRIPGLEDALLINDAVDALGRRIFGDEYGSRKRRYLDKVLMELSRQNLLGKLEIEELA